MKMAGRKSISFKTRKNQTVNLPIRLVELRMKQLKKKKVKHLLVLRRWADSNLYITEVKQP